MSLVIHKKTFKICFLLQFLRLSRQLIVFKENFKFDVHSFSLVVGLRIDFAFDPLSNANVLCDNFCHYAVLWVSTGVCNRIENSCLRTTLH